MTLWILKGKIIFAEIFVETQRKEKIQMKKVLMFYMEGCPHCARARKMVEALKAKNPEYKDVEIEEIDENKQSDISSKYDYYYVPTYYVDGEKMHEGVPSFEAIESVLKAAIG